MNQMEHNEFDKIKIGLASSDMIRSWSHGEVKKPETINYRTLKPERDGLFCERIFGPMKDWECHCGKYKRVRYKGKVCEKCHVEITTNKVRRERMGHIELAAPVSHIWYFRAIPSRMGLLLDISPRLLEKVLYFAQYIVVDPGEDTQLSKKQLLTDREYLDYREKYEDDFYAEMGAEAIKELLSEFDFERYDEYMKLNADDFSRVTGLSRSKLFDFLAKRIYVIADPAECEAFEMGEVVSRTVFRTKIARYNLEHQSKPIVVKTGSKYVEELFDAYVYENGIDAVPSIIADKSAWVNNLAWQDAQLKQELEASTGQKRIKIVKRLEVVESFKQSGNKPEWMILDAIPVIPPDIRPMVQLDGGRFATSDLNDLYRRVINRNNRLKRLMELQAPDIIIRNEKRMLQEAVDALIDNGRRGRPVTGPSNRALKSLSEMLRGKQGRFRQNLLGKRVDYSGRSVIVVGPNLKIYQCGLPKEMALELFKPFVMKRLVETGKATNIKDAKKKVERVNTEVWDALEYVIKDHPVLLNRAPTLHRLSIQAFEPVLVEGRAIKLHPLVCTAFNADFDGDQMPVHVPLSSEAQAEARFLMLSANNLLKPVNGHAVTVPTQDMVLGSYYLTIVKHDEKGEGKYFKDFDEAMMAYANGELGLHAPMKVRVTKTMEDGSVRSGIIDATLGRMIFNRSIPQDLHFVERNESNMFDLEINKVVTKDELGKIIDSCIKYHGISKTAEVLDFIKDTGYKYSTRAAISISVSDMTVPPQKKVIIEESEKQVALISKLYNKGLLTDEGRRQRVIKIWETATNDVANALTANLDEFNNIRMMAVSGARGSIKQIRQLAGMRGLMASTSGQTIELPIKANFREGLNILEYFIAARGARKGLADTALRTADSGYLTRRLVDVAQDVIIREVDCGAKDGLWVSEIAEGKEKIEALDLRLIGRFVIGDVVDPMTGEVIVADNTMISEDQANAIVATNQRENPDHRITRVNIRSVLNCLSKHGVCVHCYGSDLSSGMPVNVGESVGIIAAQSIGEPGTQLTMRTFHTGGIAGGDITQGLPRVEELFEARRPKKTSVVSDCDGEVTSIVEDKKVRRVTISRVLSDLEKQTLAKDVIEQINNKPFEYNIPLGTRVIVAKGDTVYRGQSITEGLMSPADIVRINGLDAVYEYIIKEVQKVYALQGVEINDKHIETIARQMTRKVKVEAAGSTDLLIGSVISRNDFMAANKEIEKRLEAGETGIAPAVASPMLLGITKASLSTESFLSAASFQETTKVLTEAAIKGKEDPLLGLKENVLIGKLIPAGTGMQIYRDIEIRDKEDGELFAPEPVDKEEVPVVKVPKEEAAEDIADRFSEEDGDADYQAEDAFDELYEDEEAADETSADEVTEESEADDSTDEE